MREGLERLAAAAREAIGLLDDASGQDTDFLGAVRRVEVAERIAHGVKLRLLAEADRRKAARAGIGAWLSAELGYGSSRARGLAQEARRIGGMPELAGKLTTGELNQDQTRVVERAVKAAHGSGIDAGAAVADTLTVIECEGVARAKARVRVLEETLAPGTVRDLAARQRARSFLRVGETSDGMVRIDALLDAGRGAVVRSVLDQMVAGGLHARQYDKVEKLPEDVVSVEQMGAQALTRLAEIYLNASPARRGEPHRPRTLFITRAPGSVRNSAADDTVPGLTEIPDGCAMTVYGQLVPAEGLPSMRDSAASLLTVDPISGESITLDGRALDTDPDARLASADQRTALAFRDRECSEPGCSRPVTWSLHAHHETAYREGGATVMRNLVLLCSEHHVLRHHPDHQHTT